MVTAEHILSKQCCIVTLPPLMPSFFSSLRKIPQRHDIEGTVISLLQTGNCTKVWKWPQEPKTNHHTSPTLSLQSSSPPSTFLRLQGELCEAPCKRAGLPSQTASGEQKRTCCGSAAACAPRLQKAAPLLRPGAHSLQGQGVKNRSQLSFKAILCAVKHIRE